MNFWQLMRPVIAVVMFCAMSTGAFGATASSLPPAAFGTVTRAKDVQLSPDGHSVAWIDEGANPERIIVYDLVNNRDRRILVAPSDTKLRSISWHDDDTLIFTGSATITSAFVNAKWEHVRIFANDLTTGKSKMLLMDSGNQFFMTGATLELVRTPKPHMMIMSAPDFDRAQARNETGTRITPRAQDSGVVWSLYEVDVRSGSGRLMEHGSPQTFDWVVDPSGNAVARADRDEKSGSYTLLARHGGSWKPIYQRKDRHYPATYGLTADHTAVVAVAPDADGRTKAIAIPLDGSAPTVISADPEVDVTGVMLDDYSFAPVAALYGPNHEIHWLSPEHEQRGTKVASAFAGKNVVISSVSRDAERVIARVSGPSLPAVYYLVDFATHRAAIVADEYPALADVKLGTVRELTYKARDGTSIPALLTLPPEAEHRAYPMVVLPHGGPHANDVMLFDWWSQFLASRGYAVLQPQFRGSTGYGAAFRDAGVGQWGGLMQDDVTDGVRAMIEQKIAEPGRVCIVGASYGGYAALAGATLTPDLYQCAISVAGVSDLPLFISWNERHGAAVDDATTLYWRRDIGLPLDPQVVARSPDRIAGNAKAPILLIHGEGDTVVPFEQSELMARALKDSGKSATLVRLAGEDHWLSKSETRVRMLTEIEAFLKAHL